MTAAGLTALVRDTLARPRAAADTLVKLDLKPDVLWTAAARSIVLAPLSRLPFLLFSSVDSMQGDVAFSPVMIILVRAIVLPLLICAFWIVARVLGGKAEWSHVAVVVIWTELMLGLMSFASSLVALVGGQDLLRLLQTASVLIILWVYVQFLDVVAGFDSVWRAVGGVALAFIGISVLGAIVLIMMGIGPVELSNV
jgi:hypothetical protein